MKPAPRPDSPRSWVLLSTLVTGYIAVYLCRKNLSVAMPLLRAEFHATKEEVGRIASIGTLAYAGGKMLLCPLTDHFGGRRCFLLALAAVAVFGLAGAFAPSLGILAVLYGLNRLGAAASWASMIKQIPPWFGSRNLAFAMAVLSLSYVFGGAAAVALAGQISAWSGQQWRVIMGAPSLVVIALLLVCAWLLPRDHGVDRPAASAGPNGLSWTLLRELIRMRSFWIICALSFTLTLLRETFNDWTVDFIKTEGGPHLSIRVAAFLSTPFDLCGAAGILFMGAALGRLGDRGRTRLLAGSLLALFIVLLALPMLMPLGLWAIVPAVGLAGFLGLGPYSLLGGYFSVQLRGPGCAGTVAGIVDSVGYLAGILAGSAFGWVLDRGGYTLGFQILAGLSLISAGLALCLEFGPGTDVVDPIAPCTPSVR